MNTYLQINFVLHWIITAMLCFNGISIYHYLNQRHSFSLKNGFHRVYVVVNILLAGGFIEVYRTGNQMINHHQFHYLFLNQFRSQSLVNIAIGNYVLILVIVIFIGYLWHYLSADDPLRRHKYAVILIIFAVLSANTAFGYLGYHRLHHPIHTERVSKS